MSAPITNQKYRHDIDGIRAIAIMGVIFFHAFPNHFMGGFIGVDIFFVISGFLISSIILNGFNGGQYSLFEFYLRRVCRLFPALILVMFFCLAFGWFILLAQEYEQLGKHVAGNSVFSGNFILLNESGYFDTSAERKILLHLWSLGIEEQFYIFWPLGLWWSYKKGIDATLIILCAIVISLLLNCILSYIYPVGNFYLPIGRFWELLTGAFLAIPYSKNLIIKLQINKNIASVFGIALISMSFALITNKNAYPGWVGLGPVVGTALLILGGEIKGSWINQRILAHPWLAGIGLISFPLYLWHWPLLAFLRILNNGITSSLESIVVIAASVILAWATFQFIEKPIKQSTKKKLIAFILFFLMCALGLFGYLSFHNKGWKDREVARLNDPANDFEEIKEKIESGCGLNETDKKLFAACKKDIREEPSLALLGDSKATALFPGLVNTSNNQGRWLIIGGTHSNGSSPLPSRPGQDLKLLALEAISKNPNIRIVVLVTAMRAIYPLIDRSKGYDYKYIERIPLIKNQDSPNDGFNETIKLLINGGKKVVIVIDNPVLPNPEDCFIRKIPKGFPKEFLPTPNINIDCTLSLDKYKKLTENYTELLYSLREKYPNLVFIYNTTNDLCDLNARACNAEKNGVALYAYTDHISFYAATLIGKNLNKFVNNF